MEATTEGFTLADRTDLTKYLPKHFTQKSLVYVFGNADDAPNQFSDAVYPDTRHGFYLIHLKPTLPELEPKKVPVARIGVNFDFPFLKIDQIQGARGARKHLPDSWESELVKALIGFSKDNSFKRVGITRPEEIIYYDHPIALEGRFSVEEHKAKLKRRYDETSQKLGFDLNMPLGYWVLDL